MLLKRSTVSSTFALPTWTQHFWWAERPKTKSSVLKAKAVGLLWPEREHLSTNSWFPPVSGEFSYPVERGMLGACCCALRSIFVLSTLCKRLFGVMLLLIISLSHFLEQESDSIWADSFEEVCGCTCCELGCTLKEGQACDCLKQSYHQSLGWSVWWGVLWWGSADDVSRGLKKRKDDGSDNKSHNRAGLHKKLFFAVKRNVGSAWGTCNAPSGCPRSAGASKLF